MSYMKAVCCWIKSNVKCSLSIVNKVFDKCFICYLCNKTSCNQFVIKCHFCFLSFHFSYCCSRNFVSQVSPQLCCSRALIIHNFRTPCSVVHYLHSPYKTESVLAHSVLYGSLLTKKASALLKRTKA